MNLYFFIFEVPLEEGEFISDRESDILSLEAFFKFKILVLIPVVG